MKGLTCNDLATKSESGSKTNVTRSPHGVLVTYKNLLTIIKRNTSTTKPIQQLYHPFINAHYQLQNLSPGDALEYTLIYKSSYD